MAQNSGVMAVAQKMRRCSNVFWGNRLCHPELDDEKRYKLTAPYRSVNRIVYD
jgi:hypothetical protein